MKGLVLAAVLSTATLLAIAGAFKESSEAQTSACNAKSQGFISFCGLNILEDILTFLFTLAAVLCAIGFAVGIAVGRGRRLRARLAEAVAAQSR